MNPEFKHESSHAFLMEYNQVYSGAISVRCVSQPPKSEMCTNLLEGNEVPLKN